MFNRKSCHLAFAALGVFAEAHAGHGGHQVDARDIMARSVKAKKCSDQVGLMKRSRHAMRKRDLSANDTVYEIHAEPPPYDFIKNDTCILTPEATDGPYWFPQSQVLRQDITEDQKGVPLVLEIGVVDVNTCEPMENVLIDIWHCNATGSYSSFTGRDPNTPFAELVQNVTGEAINSSVTDWRFLHTDETTWLRGMWPTDRHGATSFNTIFPGFYVQRSIHIHVQVHTNWTVTANGTLAHGRTVETGQIFIDEALEQEIMALEPYVSHTEIDRLVNDDDGIYTTESTTGAMTLLDTEPLDGVDYKNGVLGYITLGVDATKTKNGTTVDPNPSVVPL